jgi:hypothetical protein
MRIKPGPREELIFSIGFALTDCLSPGPLRDLAKRGFLPLDDEVALRRDKACVVGRMGPRL